MSECIHGSPLHVHCEQCQIDSDRQERDFADDKPCKNPYYDQSPSMEERLRNLEQDLIAASLQAGRKPIAWLHSTPGRKDIIHRDVKKLLDDALPGTSEFYTIPLYDSPVSGWRAMDSAPKDGTEIMIFSHEIGAPLLCKWLAPVEFLTADEIEHIYTESAINCQVLEEEWEHEQAWYYADFSQGGILENDGKPDYWMPVPEAPIDD